MIKIHQIPCDFEEQTYLDAIQTTLDIIKTKRLKDYLRIIKLVKSIGPIKNEFDGTLGEWKSPWGPETSGHIILARNLSGDELIAVIAHEFGHVATTFEDLILRKCPCADEWTSEVCADWYVYKWGFGRKLAKLRKSLDKMHHGPQPGYLLEYTIDEEGKKWARYQLTRNFLWKFIEYYDE